MCYFFAPFLSVAPPFLPAIVVSTRTPRTIRVRSTRHMHNERKSFIFCFPFAFILLARLYVRFRASPCPARRFPPVSAAIGCRRANRRRTDRRCRDGVKKHLVGAGKKKPSTRLRRNERDRTDGRKKRNKKIRVRRLRNNTELLITRARALTGCRCNFWIGRARRLMRSQASRNKAAEFADKRENARQKNTAPTADWLLFFFTSSDANETSQHRN